MKYEIESIRCGVFCSKLERQWFCYFNQTYKQVSYVGHVCNWRDFIIDGVSVEIKPSIEGMLVADLSNEVWRRLPSDQQRLLLVVGNPSECKIIALSRTSDGYTIREGIAINGIS